MVLIVRPLLARWHPLLRRYEESRAESVGEFVHQAAWPQREELRRDLDSVRRALDPFARVFETICGISPSMLPV